MKNFDYSVLFVDYFTNGEDYETEYYRNAPNLGLSRERMRTGTITLNCMRFARIMIEKAKQDNDIFSCFRYRQQWEGYYKDMRIINRHPAYAKRINYNI